MSFRPDWHRKRGSLNGHIKRLAESVVKPANFMTNQEIFDKIVAHLRQQKVRSTEGNICLYRSTIGLKCAVGCLINNNAYALELEGKAVGSIEVRDALLASGIPADDGDTISMLQRLQSAHDDKHPDRWERDFEYIAGKHNLIYTPL